MKCACGKPFHYKNKDQQHMVQRFSDQLGADVEVEIGDRRYSAQRHYIALHGLRAQEAETLADQGIIRRIE